jgi:hypothetical protein
MPASEIKINGAINKINLMLTEAHIIFGLNNCELKTRILKYKLNGIKNIEYVIKKFTSGATFEHTYEIINSIYCFTSNVLVFLLALNNSSANKFKQKFSTTI